ncbi:hypothetical protein EDC30_109113 [Paucimonas lemoignei]|uniref:Uncharacterized protein n=1 Tax=Paucimonas lemoignei TaxID=29443 RepID=A0A4R3HT04_PAULE|nr:hypothetical protein [Paucimonas lemoignei]TCS35814.1 hypothetical protein EDC30_109113 [Paucimonas lemoignei]
MQPERIEIFYLFRYTCPLTKKRRTTRYKMTEDDAAQQLQGKDPERVEPSREERRIQDPGKLSMAFLQRGPSER